MFSSYTSTTGKVGNIEEETILYWTKRRTARKERLSKQAVHHIVDEVFGLVVSEAKIDSRIQIGALKFITYILHDGLHTTNINCCRLQLNVKEGHKGLKLQF